MPTVEPQYGFLLDLDEAGRRQKFGLMASATWLQDPKRLVFVLSRYKFVAQMLKGYGQVLELGCADAFGSRIVRQNVSSLTALDFDAELLEDAKVTMDANWPIEFVHHDMTLGPVSKRFDAVYALDVFEHINPESEGRFLQNVVGSLREGGVLILGMPSLESQHFASEGSRAGHVNCKSGEEFRQCMKAFFEHVFMFSMNDEVVHTGFMPMAHYLFAVCVTPTRTL